MDFVEDLFAQVDPVLEGALVDPASQPTVPGQQRPAHQAGLGPRHADQLGVDDARQVAAGTMLGSLGEVLP
jgi:hypothetical protein